MGKTTGPFRYDLNQIPNDYTVEVRNRFKGLDLIDRLLENYGWKFVTFYRRYGSRSSPRKRNAKEGINTVLKTKHQKRNKMSRSMKYAKCLTQLGADCGAHGRS